MKLWDTSRWMGARLEATAEVDIPDPNLRAVIATALDKSPNAPIVRGHMATLFFFRLHLLSISETDISNLTGLEYVTNLTLLELEGNNISDISCSGINQADIAETWGE